MIQKVTIASMQIPEAMGFGSRIETGSVEFTYPGGNTDWQGVFIRGDNAFHYAMTLKQHLQTCPDSLEKAVLKGLLSDLTGCVLGSAGEQLKEGP